ncbi:MAG TPA: pyridoxamine 5'-phosphate oxidase [Idiomarina abyssalis]|jgi:pyridoxamine 5'-phosphate oxidase|uniref:pyridoxamine 5'-phosphate oxidase n=1 Tax=Idiomarina TaxID=135575 RepID=UPI000C0A208A|nr:MULTISPECIES: pyridoxamine 5'-phosphate oxidase [Idiomarina]MAL84073.1 pyridoxamine 5'-phosphate oxidase [Idiomarina sp.]MBH94997.1 pyridoxamine 5'-phosphate oxidase [Idiomarina sp.]HAS15746.1 pyridoxamine 5'-phosphate oxidase [Idiomarina abyssalis]|tara:strand:+ start:609 stop:1247 length:639 start_codon:yes stop_codon:yes gene_type:complete
MDLQAMRREYGLGSLHREQLNSDPIKQFELWMQQAIDSGLLSDPTAMTVATVNNERVPSQRIVLLKGYDHKGFRFYTNKNSQKGQDISTNSQVNLHFAWLPLERQISITGSAIPLDSEDNDRYFHSRPKESQVAALASQQSRPVESRDVLESHYKSLLREYENTEVPRPEHWGGYCIEPQQFEFWQGGQHRLHDRYLYSKDGAHWRITRLQP